MLKTFRNRVADGVFLSATYPAHLLNLLKKQGDFRHGWRFSSDFVAERRKSKLNYKDHEGAEVRKQQQKLFATD